MDVKGLSSWPSCTRLGLFMVAADRLTRSVPLSLGIVALALGPGTAMDTPHHATH